MCAEIIAQLQFSKTRKAPNRTPSTRHAPCLVTSIYKEINMTNILDPLLCLLNATDDVVGDGCAQAPTLTPGLMG